MKTLFWIAAIVCGVLSLGAIGPLLPGLTILFIVLAIGTAPSGKRVDGRSRTGGLLGGLWDNHAAPSKECHACMAEIPKGATRCQHCTEKQ